MTLRTACVLTGLFLGVSGALVTGCSSGATKDGTTYKYEFGTLSASIDASLDKTYDAAVKALESFELTVSEKAKDAFQAQIEAKDALDKNYRVKLQRVGDTVTKVSIGIGSFGDEAKASQIMSKIESLATGG